MGLQVLLPIEVQFIWMVVHFTMKGVPVPEGPTQDISLEVVVFLDLINDGLVISNYLGVTE